MIVFKSKRTQVIKICLQANSISRFRQGSKKSPRWWEKVLVECLWRVRGLRIAGIVRKPAADIVIEIYGDNIFGDKELGISI